eukprot:1641920-Prymnesium_polylepis.1
MPQDAMRRRVERRQTTRAHAPGCERPPCPLLGRWRRWSTASRWPRNGCATSLRLWRRANGTTRRRAAALTRCESARRVRAQQPRGGRGRSNRNAWSVARGARWQRPA